MPESLTSKEILLQTKSEKYPDIISLVIYSDGAVAFSKDYGESFIYLYPDVVERVKKELSSLGGKT